MSLCYIPILELISDGCEVVNVWQNWGVYEESLKAKQVARQLYMDANRGEFINEYIDECEMNMGYRLSACLFVYEKSEMKLVDVISEQDLFKTYECGYIPDMDITVLFENKDFISGEPQSTELVAWCYGNVEFEEVLKYKGKLKAEYGGEFDVRH